MKYLTSSTTSISFVIAVVLFVVASLIEGDRDPPPPPDPETTPQMHTGPRPDSPVRDELAQRDCQTAESRLLQRLELSQSCSVDSDCTILDYGYPIQCLTSVAQSEVGALRVEYRNYEENCSFRVYYDCPSEPLERQAVCRNNRCEVELRTLDLLKERTFEHLGIEPPDEDPR